MKLIDIMKADKSPNWKLVQLTTISCKEKPSVLQLSYALNLPAREVARLLNESI